MRKILIIISLFFIDISAYAQQKHDELRTNYLRQSKDTTKLDSALFTAFKVRDAAIKEFGNKSMPYFRALNNIGYIYSAMDNWKKAEHWWMKAYRELMKLPDTFSTAAYIYQNLQATYIYHFPDLEKATFFTDKHIYYREKMISDTTRAFLNEIVSTAYDFQVNFGIEASEKYFGKALKIRENIFGKRSAEIIRGIDSIVLIEEEKADQLADYRYNIYSVLEDEFSMPEIDSMSKAELLKSNSWNAIFYTSEMTNLGLKMYGDTSEKFIAGLQRLGIVYQNFFRSDSAAVFCLKKAMQILEENNQKMTAKYIDVNSDLAAIYADMKKYDIAVSIGENNLSIAKEIEGDSSDLYADALVYMAKLIYDTTYIYEEAFLGAAQKFNNALAIKEKLWGANSLQYATVLRNFGIACLWWGKLDSAEHLFLQAYPLIANFSFLDNQYYLARQIYMTYSYKDDDAKSGLWMQKCLAIKKQIGDTISYEYIQDLHNSIGISIGLNDFKKADEGLSEMKRIIRSNYKPASVEHLLFLKIKTKTELGRKNYDSAGLYLKEMLSVLQDSTKYIQTNYLNINDIADAAYELAGINLQKGLNSEARKFNSVAFQKMKSLGYDSSAKVSHLYVQLAEIFENTGYLDSALLCYSGILKILQETGWENNTTYYEERIKFASMLWRNHKLDTAEQIMSQSCTKLKDIMISQMAGFSEKEKQQYNTILQQSLFKYYNLQREIYAQKPAANVNAFNLLLQSKGLLLNTSGFLQNSISSSGNPVLIKQYDQLKNIRKKLAAAYSRKDQKLNTDSLEKEAGQIEQQLSFNSTAFAKFHENNNITFNNIKNTLAKDESAIEFVAYPYFDGREFKDSTLLGAYIVTAKNASVAYVSLPATKKIASLLSGQGVAGRGMHVNKVNSDGINVQKQLYNLVWKPLNPFIQDAKNIYLSADGVLHKVAFNSLQDSSNTFLIDKYNFHFVLSTKDIDKNNHKKANNKNITAALFGGSKYDAKNDTTAVLLAGNRSLPDGLRGGKTWNYLPNTLTEIQEIDKLLQKQKWQAKIYQGLNATEENIKSLSGNSPYFLHIATHGFYFPQTSQTTENTSAENVYNANENPLLRTGLVFTAANDAWLGKHVAPGREDGILTAYEFANLDFSNTELIVLSACETGIGDVMNGEGVFGLQRAIKQAGINKMLVSLWPVPDKETAEMMEEFYAQLASGKSTANAFREAQYNMRRRYPKNPALWAGFVLIE